MHVCYTLYICPQTFVLFSKLNFSKQQKSKPSNAVLPEAFLSVPELCCINGWLSWYTSEKHSNGLAHTLIHQNQASSQ